MSNLFKVVWAAACVLGVSAGVQAQQDAEIVSQPGVPILNFDVDNVGPILTEMEYLWQARRAPDGSPFILANAEGNTVFVITPLACRGAANTDCVGMQLISVFDGDADRNTVQDFNNRYAFANLGINERGNAYMNRYDIADYGIARGNVATIIETFAGLSKIYQDSVGRGGATASVSVEGGIVEASVNAHTPEGQGLPLHEAGDVLSRVFADEALPKNKILNVGQ